MSSEQENSSEEEAKNNQKANQASNTGDENSFYLDNKDSIFNDNRNIFKNTIYNIGSKNETTEKIITSPIKGLLAFDFKDVEVFSHLERKTDIERISGGILSSSYKIGLLVGESGCGKTSLLQAGVMPNLESNTLTCVLVNITNKNPLESVYIALRSQLFIEKLSLRQNLIEILEDALKEIQPKRIILILDQFEQFFTQNFTSNEQEKFTEQLTYLAEKLQVKILFSMRADFTNLGIELLEIAEKGKNYFELKKFTIPQVVRILSFIANITNTDFDEKYVEKFVKSDLSDNNGLVSATDIQIVIQALKEKQDLLNFTEKAIQQVGGINGLLRQYLEEQLSTPNRFNKNNAILYVLLTLIDGNVRSGQLTLREISDKFPGTIENTELSNILDWLEGRRVIKLIQIEDQPKRYELVHEKLIEPIRSIENKSEIGTRKANALLDKRVNEWLGNNRSSGYLLDVKDYFRIKKFERLINWGKQESSKRELLKESKKRVFLWIGTAISVLAICFSGWMFTLTNFYELNYRIPNEIENTFNKALSEEDQLIVLDSISKYQYDIAAKISKDILYDIKDEYKLTAVHFFYNHRQFTDAYQIANSIKEDSIRYIALSDLVESLASSKFFDEAIRITSSIKNSKMKMVSLARLAIVKAKANNFKEAIEISNTISNPNIKNYALGEVCRVLISTKRFKEALQLANSLNEAWKKEVIAEIIKRLSNQSLYLEGIKLASLISDPSTKRFAIEEFTLDEALSMANAKNFAEAFKLANSFKDSTRKFSALRYIAIMKAKDKHFEEAIQILNSTKGSEYAVSLAFLDIAEEMAKTNQYGKIVELAYKINEEIHNRDDCQEDIASLLAKAQRFKEAIQIARSIKDQSIKESALSDISSQFAEANQVKEAIQLANSISSLSKRNNTFENITRTLIETGQLKAAVQVVNFIDNQNNKNEIKKDIILSMTEEKLFIEAILLVNSVEPDGGSESYENIRLAYWEVIHAMADENDFTRPIDIAKSLKDKSDKNKIFEAVGFAMVIAKKLPEAIQIANLVSNLSMKSAILANIAKGMIQANLFTEAMQLIKTLPNTSYIDIARGNVAIAMAKSKQFQRAFELANSISRSTSSLKKDVFRNISISMAHNYQFKEAIQLITSIDNLENENDYALREIAITLANAQQFTEAIKLIKSVHDKSFKNEGIRIILLSMIRKKKFSDAYLFLQTLSDTEIIKTHGLIYLIIEWRKYSNIKTAIL